MSFTNCCNLRYIGENHNPVSNGFCYNCNHIDDNNQNKEKIKGAIEALTMFAVWRNGEQWTNDMRTLKEAIISYVQQINKGN